MFLATYNIWCWKDGFFSSESLNKFKCCIPFKILVNYFTVGESLTPSNISGFDVVHKYFQTHVSFTEYPRGFND